MKTTKLLLYFLLVTLISCSNEDDFSPCEKNELFEAIDNSVTIETYGLKGKIINKLEANSNTIIAATDDGVYYKNFSAECWTQSNLKHEFVLAIVRLNSSQLICSTVKSKDDYSLPKLYKSENNGVTWLEISNNFTGDNELFASSLAFNTSSNTLYAGGIDIVASSTDGGKEWTPLYGSWDGLGRGISEIRINPTNNDIWFGGQNAIEMQRLVHLSFNGTIINEWVNLLPAPSTVEKIILNNETILIGGEDGILKSEDNGTNWEIIYQNSQIARFYYGLENDNNNPNRFIAASWDKNYYDPQPLIIHISENEGQTWKTISTLNNSNYDSLFGGTRTMIQRTENGKTVLYLGLWKGGVLKATLQN